MRKFTNKVITRTLRGNRYFIAVHALCAFPAIYPVLGRLSAHHIATAKAFFLSAIREVLSSPKQKGRRSVQSNPIRKSQVGMPSLSLNECIADSPSLFIVADIKKSKKSMPSTIAGLARPRWYCIIPPKKIYPKNVVISSFPRSMLFPKAEPERQ